MAITINMGTLSRVRALLTSALLAGLVLYTLHTISPLSSPPPPPRAPRTPPPAEPTDPIPHGISVFDSDPYEKHLVVPKMHGEDVFWLTYFPPEMRITPKLYLIDADRAELAAGALTTPMNKVCPPRIPYPPAR